MGLFARLTRKSEAPQKEKLVVLAPVSGEVVSLEDGGDQAFASRALGDGVAIIPRSGPVLAPVAGTVEALFPTAHALAIQADDGKTQVMVHIGVDTVNMAGDGFSALVTPGERVSAGQPLIDVDVERISQAGYRPTTFVTLCAREPGTSVREHEAGAVAAGDALLWLS